jgi:hypothetical protein
MMVIWIAVLALLASACAGHPATSPGGPAPGVLANASPAGSAGGAGPAVSCSAPPTFAPVPTNLPAIPPGAVPILYYHSIQAPPPDYPSWTSARQAAFIDYDGRAHSLCRSAQLAHQPRLHHDPVAGSRRVLGSRRPAAGATGDPTFDEGWQDWVSTVLPMLQARGMVAEFDLTLTAIGDGNITWPEVEASGRGRQWNRLP